MPLLYFAENQKIQPLRIYILFQQSCRFLRQVVLVAINTVMFSSSLSASTVNELNYNASETHNAPFEKNSASYYLIPKASPLHYSTICTIKPSKITRYSPITEKSYTLNLLTSSVVVAALPITTGQLKSGQSIHHKSNPENYLTGGSALGAMLKMGLKSWWKNNDGTQLHRIGVTASKSIPAKDLSTGKVKYDWDYSLKLSHDKVKLKLEKAF